MGVRQQSAPPVSSALNLTIQGATAALANPPAVNVVIRPASDGPAAPGDLALAPELFGADGFSNVTINTGSGAITVASDAVITTLAGGSLNFTAANIIVDGQIDVPSGSINLTALTKDPINKDNPLPYNPAIGNIEVGSDAIIATTGLTFDEVSGAAPGTLSFSVNGGKITLSGAVTTLAAAALSMLPGRGAGRCRKGSRWLRR